MNETIDSLRVANAKLRQQIKMLRDALQGLIGSVDEPTDPEDLQDAVILAKFAVNATGEVVYPVEKETEKTP